MRQYIVVLAFKSKMVMMTMYLELYRLKEYTVVDYLDQINQGPTSEAPSFAPN